MADLQQQQVAKEKQQQQQQLAAQEQARFFTNPNPTMRDAARYASLLSPEQSKAFLPFMEGISKEQQQGTLKSTGQILSALQASPEIGIKLLQERAIAAQNIGDTEDANLFNRLAEAAIKDPVQGSQTAFKALVQSSAGIPGAKEFFETIDKGLTTAQSQAEAPSKLKEQVAKADKAVADAITAQATATNSAEKAAADAAKATADANKAKIDAQFAGPLAQANLNLNAAQIKNINSEINNRAAKLNLDAQSMQATVAEKLSSIQKNLNDIPADTRKLINEAAVAGSVAKQSADQFNDLAKRIEGLGGYGKLATLGEFAKSTIGAEGYETSLRQEYTRLRNQAAIKSLPPGPATDKDIEMALKGFPKDTSDSKSIAQFLKGMAKLQEIESAVNNSKTDWLAQNRGTLTRAGATFTAGDYAVKPGETFNDFSQRVAVDVNKKYASGGTSALVEQIPTDRNPTPGAAQVNVRSQADAILRGGK